MKAIAAAAVLAMAAAGAAAARDLVPPGPGTPATIPFGGWVWGQGDYDGDRDAYRVTIPAGQLFGVATGSYGCVGGGSLKLFDAGFHLLKTTPAPEGTYAWIQWQALYTGDYYVQVTARGGACSDPVHPGEYWVSASPDCAGDRTTTCGLPGDTTNDGMIWSEKDRDWMVWNVTVAGTYHIEAQDPEDGDNTIGSAVLLRRADTSIVARSADTPEEAHCSSAGYYGHPCIEVALEPGQYFIVVNAGEGARGAGYPYMINAYQIQ